MLLNFLFVFLRGSNPCAAFYDCLANHAAGLHGCVHFVTTAVQEVGIDEGRAPYDCAAVKMLKKLTSSIHAQR
jgi:hypothetical protein